MADMTQRYRPERYPLPRGAADADSDEAEPSPGEAARYWTRTTTRAADQCFSSP